MPAKYGCNANERKKVTDLEKLGYTIIPDNMRQCSKCGKILSVDSSGGNFYQSYSDLHKGNIAPRRVHRKNKDTGKKEWVREIQSFATICKSCLLKDLDINNIDSVMEVLYRMDIAYIDEIWKNNLKNPGESNEATFGAYVKDYALRDKTLRFKDSEDYIDENSISNSAKCVELENRRQMVEMFGEGFSDKLYKEFHKKYLFLSNNYDEKTAMHTEALIKYIKYSVLEEQSIIDGDDKKAKVWGEQANKAATSAKINPSQMTKADLSEGLSTLSELSLAVEKAVDVIPILPKFKYRPNDALDFNIWCYVNYERHLRGYPLVEYSDVYKFYDERVEEYISQYGDPYNLFTSDPTKNNRPKVEKFIPIEEEE